VRDVSDVLTAVELAIAGRTDIVAPVARPGAPVARPSSSVPRALGSAAGRVRRALDHDPASLEVVVRRTGMNLGEVALALEELAEAGLAHAAQGFWSRIR
jgi:predicted Rossmann fold nucleotide-binding protein DprA/Smf involved in DNA uptake